MGVISRKLFPACESMCVCCPALRSRSRQPVKRYKKLLAEIFPKSDGVPNERKIIKLCEYAAKNPFRIPKIAKYLEERCYKELRSEHIKFINIVTETYNKLLCMCKEQIAYFAISLLSVVSELLDKPKQDALLILGCQTLTSFIYSQTDGTYTHNIEKFVHQVCNLARVHGDEHHTSCLRASSLQCLSAMVWFMAKFLYIFSAFDEIVQVTLDNYGPDMHDDARGETHHNWVDEVVRSEGRGAVGSCDTSSSCMIIRPRPERKEPSLLTREEIETPKVWAQICIQRMVELAKESTTMRQVLDPMFVYFDSGRHWVPLQGLSITVLSDMCYLLESSGHQQLVLAAVIRHLDHKNVVHDPQLKSYVIQVAALLARQIRSEVELAEIGFVSDLCRHLRKSLQATVESVGEQESNLNVLLQKSIEDCLLEIAKAIRDAQPLFDMMAITLENLPSSGVVAHATVGSLIVLAHMISLSSVSSSSQQGFPEALLVQLLKVMLHPDVGVRVGAHQIFSMLLIPSSNHSRHGVVSLHSGYICEPRRWRSNAASTFSSISELLEKLRREKDGARMEKHKSYSPDDYRERDITEEDWKQGRPRKNSPNFYKISSIIDRTSGTTSLIEEPYVMTLSEDQIAQLLSAFWLQANLPDNLPSNFEAMAHSYMLTLISSRLKSSSDGLMVRFFQLSLSLRNLSLDPNNGIGMLRPACRRSILVLSTGMLMFSAKIYQFTELDNLVKLVLPYDVDPYLGISDDLQVHAKPQADVRDYGSASDNQLASSLLLEMKNKAFESDKVIMDTLIQNISNATELEVDYLAGQLSEPFTPDDAFVFGPRSLLDLDHNPMVSHSKESLSFDEDMPTSSLIEDDATSEASVADMSRFIPKIPSSPSVSHIISIGKLLESALEVAGQVAGTSISTSPLPYDTMAKQCEDLGKGTRKKLSNWLAQETQYARGADKFLPAIPASGCPAVEQVMCNMQGAVKPMDPCLAMRLPPASPFDNFLKAAGC
ncbi:protein SEMI-ROLLED LEAF 2 isoform X2 [Manihot esculenta]|uniref:Uncharacterized protein n=2 Tax=Manihot esculenta TaxID=3983 RepID=A0A2C9VBS5_MANES|nr:protein SEMI-ROLLED LEAF 2 isoform X2 [Manihot esculenta]KAG8648315.1 hypothetical protein MANES_09G177000v8 [Manihot esculenta]OAY42397.1 hypothetical protein MANES_09G177000v8 [Manihot esculenta]